MIGLLIAYLICKSIAAALPSFPIHFSIALVLMSMMVSVLTGQATQREAAEKWKVDRSTVVHICRTAKQGALVSAILNLGQAVGRPIIGLSSDRYGRLNVAVICTFACGLCCCAFWCACDRPGLETPFPVP